MHARRHSLPRTLNVPTKVPHMAMELFSAADTPKSVTFTCVKGSQVWLWVWVVFVWILCSIVFQYLASRIDQQVGGLDVPVYALLAFEICQRPKYLCV